MAVSFTVCHCPLERMVNFLLYCRGFHGIIDTKNKNAAAYGCANTRKPAQVKTPPIQRPQTASAWDIIRHSTLVCKGWPLPYLFLLPFFVWWNMLFTLCRLARTVFLFFRQRPGGYPSGAAAVFRLQGGGEPFLNLKRKLNSNKVEGFLWLLV